MIENNKAKRDHDGHDPRAGQVAQEDEENRDHQSHADQQVVQHVVRRHVHELGALVENLDLSSPWEGASPSGCASSFSRTALDTGSDFSYFRISTMPSTTSFSLFPSTSRPMIPRRG